MALREYTFWLVYHDQSLSPPPQSWLCLAESLKDASLSFAQKHDWELDFIHPEKFHVWFSLKNGGTVEYSVTEWEEIAENG